MALIQCDDCGQEVSMKAKSCPKCGNPITDEERANVVVQSDNSTAAAILAVGQKKSMGIALLLTFFFGPLGLLYSSVAGGLILLVLTIVIGLITLGIGFFVGWIASMIWAAVAVNSHNAKIMNTYSKSIAK